MRGRPNPEGYEEVMRLRREHGWGRRRLAQATGVPEGTIAAWIYGSTNPIARAQRRDAYLAQPLPRTKRCTKCRRVKRVPQDFSVRTYGESVRLEPSCKQCKREAARAWRESVGPEQMRTKNRQWTEARQRRRKEDQSRANQRLDKWPLIRMLLAQGLLDHVQHAPTMGIDRNEYDRLDRMSRANSETHTVPFELADRVYTNLGLQAQFRVDYPLSRSESTKSGSPAGP